MGLSGCDAARALEAGEQIFGLLEHAIKVCLVTDWSRLNRAKRCVGRSFYLDQFVAEPVGIEAAVPE
jgi:hypothetical protein